ncbi:hypothetical protein K466DRAFT_14108 [Polyporus arcularius HHB13444]|uniref:Uncharacterized protein n=1 Tax=Polyporus arcularius HHB13444 TaxID=1314778 RepID=A0A5C3NU62_9APHY|nr:hypothetical protein K466DRAFT_14108 [Polyporus arcularius HHB13444]
MHDARTLSALNRDVWGPAVCLELGRRSTRQDGGRREGETRYVTIHAPHPRPCTDRGYAQKECERPLLQAADVENRPSAASCTHFAGARLSTSGAMGVSADTRSRIVFAVLDSRATRRERERCGDVEGCVLRLRTREGARLMHGHGLLDDYVPLPCQVRTSAGCRCPLSPLLS